MIQGSAKHFFLDFDGVQHLSFEVVSDRGLTGKSSSKRERGRGMGGWLWGDGWGVMYGAGGGEDEGVDSFDQFCKVRVLRHQLVHP